MSHVFVSYSRKDSETVANIVARLERDGLSVWLDREDIRGGELWRETIVKAIDNAYAFVLMLSSNSVASENVRKEVDLAEGANKHLLPVMLALSNYQPNCGINWRAFNGLNTTAILTLNMLNSLTCYALTSQSSLSANCKPCVK